MRPFLLLLCLAAVQLYAAEERTFRIRFGLTDQKPSSWDGSVRVSGGQATALRSWRPRGEDRIEGLSSWQLATTKGVKFKYRNWEPEPSSPVPDYVYHPGIFLTVAAEGDARVDINTAQGAFSFRLADAAPGRPLRFLNGAVIVERAAGYASVSEQGAGKGRESGFADLVGDGEGYWTAWVGYRDWSNRVFARRFDGRAFGETVELTGGPSDVYKVKLAADGQGGFWAVWSDQREGNFDLYARRFDGSSWGAEQRLTTDPQPDIHQALATDADGGVWLVWQGFREGRADIFGRRWSEGSWSAEQRISASSNDDWNPAIAADKDGRVWVAWDTYDKGDYDVVMRRHDASGWSPVTAVADTPRYEAYPSLRCDAQGRLWAAWNESDMQWGKDTGWLLNRPATQLYQSRWMRLAVYENDSWREPLASLEASLPQELQGFNDFPRVEIDGSGRLWVLFRHRFLRQREVPPTAASHRAAWESFVTGFDGQSWSTPMPLAVSQHRSDAGLGFAALASGGLAAAWATDNRIYDELIFEHGEVFAGEIPRLSGPVVSARTRPRVQDELTFFSGHPNEVQDLERIRGYRIESGGKTYRIYRGDTHRHTEYSGDGNNDGSLNDTYRYALNAAELDYLGLSDHHNSGGPNIEYINWLLQQRVDVFHAPGRFVPLFGYERGESYPNGHRNVFFAKRGNPTLPTQPREQETSSAQVGLYDYLKKYDGISIPHTPATGMGTDWRDNDPEVEPLVEIYQGDRVSAEYEGAPKAAIAGDETSQAGGFKPKGYVWNAWEKGYKIGVQASSDHLSTHISYSCTIAEEFSRDGLIAAMKQRHNYAATDNIILDYRLRDGSKEYLQGDIVTAAGRKPQLAVKVIGTAPIRQIDIIRGKEFVYTVQNQGPEVDLTFVDNDPPSGESYYYVRVQQANDEMAWSSPIWVVRK
ncbi:MAG: DUF3604 domain-containing protein [Acidobacteria bacterium]|nr:DUF3604 domain-containing protein [Acidobacteriota bacterium]